MKIKIRSDAKQAYINSVPFGNGWSMPINWEWAETMEKIQGMTLEVETEYLFKDQFNTGPIEGISKDGLRIMLTVVEEVIDDIRPFKQRCNWCGKISDIGPKCPHCDKEEYLERFTKQELKK